jgi:hypothetical protein
MANKRRVKGRARPDKRPERRYTTAKTRKEATKGKQQDRRNMDSQPLSSDADSEEKRVPAAPGAPASSPDDALVVNNDGASREVEAAAAASR